MKEYERVINKNDKLQIMIIRRNYVKENTYKNTEIRTTQTTKN